MLTWNEIRARSGKFATDWASEVKENAEAQTFWNEFLELFGLERRKVAKFEKAVTGLEKKNAKSSGSGRIDLLWPGLFMAEHKSKGKDLEGAMEQALGYVNALEAHERPKHIAISDFARMRLHDVEKAEPFEFPLAELPNYVEKFGFLIGKQVRHLQESDPVNVKAAEQMGKLHNELKASGYSGHALEVLLVRMLFLLFGDDTGLWDERGLFEDVIADNTRSDGQDTGSTLERLFQVLDTPRDKRSPNLPEWLNAFPYVNGELFSESIKLADFSKKMRLMLLEASRLDWGGVSPAIFGSMFQSVMDKTERRSLGAHYTSEKNILKALSPLFLDELQIIRDNARGDNRKLKAFLDLLPRLRFLDPACGSGNFLLIAYRELRRLELDALIELQKDKKVLDVEMLINVNVGQFYGIEYDEFPSQIARTAMWLADHQANIEASTSLGKSFVNLPLEKAAHILHGDALEADWLEHLEIEKDKDNIARVYIVGNPPFVGSSVMSKEQKAQTERVFQGVKLAGKLDYVANWYLKSANLMNDINSKYSTIITATSLVSTNSICQGEQVAPLWSTLFYDKKMQITSAHQTFKWSNEARGQAAVHCIIVQFELKTEKILKKRLFTYEKPNSEAAENKVDFINAYLIDSMNIIVEKCSKPFWSNIQEMVYGNKPVEGTSSQLKITPQEGNLIISSDEELHELLSTEPTAQKFIKVMLDADDFLNGGKRYCLWLVDAEPSELAKMPKVRERIARVRAMRLASKKEQTQEWANRPSLFVENRHPNSNYLALPRITSERREYIPLGFLNQDVIVNDKVYILPDADLLTFGLVQCRLHMDWMRLTSGRLESRYSYSIVLTYNTYPWLNRSKLSEKEKSAIEKAAQSILDTRANHPNSTLAQMYDPLYMPADLRKAHNALDRAVETLYGLKSGATEAKRLSVLLEKYKELIPSLDEQTAPKKTRKKTEKRK